MAEQGPGSFTAAVAELEAAGFTSAGFGLDAGIIVCMECGADDSLTDVDVPGMLRYENAAGEGHVFALVCHACQARGLLFVAGDAASDNKSLVDALDELARK